MQNKLWSSILIQLHIYEWNWKKNQLKINKKQPESICKIRNLSYEIIITS
jgi:hypothetical protein